MLRNAGPGRDPDRLFWRVARRGAVHRHRPVDIVFNAQPDHRGDQHVCGDFPPLFLPELYPIYPGDHGSIGQAYQHAQPYGEFCRRFGHGGGYCLLCQRHRFLSGINAGEHREPAMALRNESRNLCVLLLLGVILIAYGTGSAYVASAISRVAAALVILGAAALLICYARVRSLMPKMLSASRWKRYLLFFLLVALWAGLYVEVNYFAYLHNTRLRSEKHTSEL